MPSAVRPLFSLVFILSVQSVWAAGEPFFPVAGVDLNSQNHDPQNRDKEFRAEAATDRVQVVVFLSAKCPCSDSHTDELKNLAKDFLDVQFVGVHSNLDESVEMAKEYFKKKNLPFPIVQDRGNAIADRFKALKTPHAYVFSKNAVVYRGGVSDRKTFRADGRLYLREALEDLKQNRPLRTPEARSLGCALPRS